MSIADIIEKVLKNYDMKQLMEDCNHIDSIHCNDSISGNRRNNGKNPKFSQLLPLCSSSKHHR